VGFSELGSIKCFEAIKLGQEGLKQHLAWCYDTLQGGQVLNGDVTLRNWFCISSLFMTGDFLQCLIGYLKRLIVVTIFGYDQLTFINLLKTTSSHLIGLCSVNACSMQQRALSVG
jgi:hypothetical protein